MTEGSEIFFATSSLCLFEELNKARPTVALERGRKAASQKKAGPTETITAEGGCTPGGGVWHVRNHRRGGSFDVGLC